MRRKEREITDIKEIDDIIERADVCRIALSDNNIPYIVTMNFGYRKGERPALFLHCAAEGKKTEIIKRNNLACSQMSTDHKLVETHFRCNCGMQYKSVVGMGRIFFITEYEDKIEALNNLMQHYHGHDRHQFKKAHVNTTTVLRLDIDEISGKKCEYQVE
jgi:nitroimidazol reductase NimA-like FMN-containing flavoprotein (pyridoxamine 5'-phosphate oxidase superfamily)